MGYSYFRDVQLEDMPFSVTGTCPKGKGHSLKGTSLDLMVQLIVQPVFPSLKHRNMRLILWIMSNAPFKYWILY